MTCQARWHLAPHFQISRIENRSTTSSSIGERERRNIPYFGWRQAFRGLVHYLLMERAEHLAAWKHVILEAVGESGQVLTDVIPDLELVIGPQPAIPELNRNRHGHR